MKSFLMSSANKKPFLTEIGFLALRFFVGLTMALAHGMGKIPPQEKMIERVTTLGFPAPEFFAWAAGLAEFAGGLFLALGLLTRPASIFIAFTMLVAAFGAHGDDPFSKQELSLFYFFASMFFFLAGAGKISLDRIFFKK